MVVGGDREVEGGPAVADVAASLPDPVETFHMEIVRTSEEGEFGGYRLEEAGPSPYMLIGDPFSFPSDFLLGHVNDRVPGTVVVTLPPEDRELIGRGLHVGRVIDQYRSELERGDSSGTQTQSRGSLILVDESPDW